MTSYNEKKNNSVPNHVDFLVISSPNTSKIMNIDPYFVKVLNEEVLEDVCDCDINNKNAYFNPLCPEHNHFIGIISEKYSADDIICDEQYASEDFEHVLDILIDNDIEYINNGLVMINDVYFEEIFEVTKYINELTIANNIKDIKIIKTDYDLQSECESDNVVLVYVEME